MQKAQIHFPRKFIINNYKHHFMAFTLQNQATKHMSRDIIHPTFNF